MCAQLIIIFLRFPVQCSLGWSASWNIHLYKTWKNLFQRDSRTSILFFLSDFANKNFYSTVYSVL